METIFRALLSVSSVSLLPIIYFLKERKTISDVDLAFCLIIALISILVIFLLIPKLSKDEMNKTGIVDIENQVDNFLPSYLGYIFISLSVPDNFTLFTVFIIVFIFTYISQDNYFNPIFLLFGYKFYKVKKSDGFSFFLISKSSIKNIDEIEKHIVYRINNYTFIQKD